MSSIIAEGSVYEGKLLIDIAENGHSFELDCAETTLVDSVLRFVESVSGISFNDQLVLCADTKLDPRQPLSAYKLPSSDREVFIFNKSRLQTNSLPPPLEEVSIPEITEPPSPSCSTHPHPLDDSPDPAMKALPSYERQFRYHFQWGNSIYGRTYLVYEMCERFLAEIKVQERAIEVARTNLEQYYKVVSQNFVDFMKKYMHQSRSHSDLLANFERDLDKLRLIKLHPNLQKDSRKCLLDFIKEEELRKAAENCKSSHKQFENKILQFKQTYEEVKQKVEELFCGKALPVRNLERTVREHQRYINEQRSIMQSLSKDINTVKKLVDDCLSAQQLSSSLRPHDAVSALGPMYEVHDKDHLPRMLSCDQSILKLLELCRDRKNEMSSFLHTFIQRITYASFFIKDVKLQFPVFREAMVRQDDLFVDLRLSHGLGPVYRACLAEVVRRRASMKLYMAMAGQMAERLAARREIEMRRREEFLKAQGSYLPQDVLVTMGLYDMPSQCDVNVAPFDVDLLNIDVSEIDRYAPECLVGWPKDFALEDTSDSTSSMELFEGSELLAIAGTTKVEVENAKLKADLASKIAELCSLRNELEYMSLDESQQDKALKDATEKMAEALRLKDEYERNLQSMLMDKQRQCESYEERIRELEQRLLEQKVSLSKYATDLDALGVGKVEEKAQGGPDLGFSRATESVDEASCISSSFIMKLGILTGEETSNRAREGGDENMMDSSGTGIIQHHLYSSMSQTHHEEMAPGVDKEEKEAQGIDKDQKEEKTGALGMSLGNSSTAETCLPVKGGGDPVAALHTVLVEKSNELTEMVTKLNAALEENAVLNRELEVRQRLLDESQMNRAHLENCLHEAREEAQTHLCAADRRASEYSAIRASAVKMRGLFEMLHSYVYAPGGVAGFADSLCALAQSLANSLNENEDDGKAEFSKCIRVLADRVNFLSKHRLELLDMIPKLELANEKLRKELEEKEELIKTLYKRLQLEKQANKEKISFDDLEVHRIAAFVLNSNGYYEAVTRNSPNYYLSSESVALFADCCPTRPTYIVGQIVHIERQIAKPLSLPSNRYRAEPGKVEQVDCSSTRQGTDPAGSGSGSSLTPYGLPIGCQFFIVTIAMLPDPAIHSPPAY